MPLLLLALALVLLSGCATIGNESLATRAADWPPLTMTQAELVTELGPPTSMTTTIKDGQTVNVLSWSYARTESHPALFIPIVGLFVAASGEGMSSTARNLTVAFDTGGMMTSRTWTKLQHGRANGGTAGHH